MNWSVETCGIEHDRELNDSGTYAGPVEVKSKKTGEHPV